MENKMEKNMINNSQLYFEMCEYIKTWHFQFIQIGRNLP